MIGKKRSKTFLSLLMALLIVGTANHCIIEDFFVAFSKVILGIEEPHHFPNHQGSDAPHKHGDSPEHHQHGQPHFVLAIHFQKTATDVLSSMLVFSFLCFVAIHTFGYFLFERKEVRSLPNAIGGRAGYLENLISALTLAPQAPPV